MTVLSLLWYPLKNFKLLTTPDPTAPGFEPAGTRKQQTPTKLLKIACERSPYLLMVVFFHSSNTYSKQIIVYLSKTKLLTLFWVKTLVF